MSDEAGVARSPDGGVSSDPNVEDNGPWFGVFLFVVVTLFAAAAAAVIHSLVATFG
jgi:hypothetical protein